LFVNFPGFFGAFYFKRNGYKIACTPNAVSASMFVGGSAYLSEDEGILSSLVDGRDFFIDVGANIGHLSIALAVNNGARGIAVEANPVTFKALTRNIRLNRLVEHVTALNLAVGNVDGGSVEIQHSYSDDCNSVVVEPSDSGVPLYTVPHSRTFRVTAQSLDGIAAERDLPERIRLLKVDTEGFELFVLQGGYLLLQRTELVYFEIWDRLTWKYGYGPGEVLSFLDRAGFDVWIVAWSPSDDGDSMRRTLTRLHDDLDFRQQHRNLLAVNRRFDVRIPDHFLVRTSGT
jgi:FkbM family methyltransferase